MSPRYMYHAHMRARERHETHLTRATNARALSHYTCVSVFGVVVQNPLIPWIIGVSERILDS